MQKPQKKEFVKKLTSTLKDAKSVVLVNYSGMDIKSQQDLKKKLKEAKAKMIVVKNTLFRIAAKEAGLPEGLGEEAVLAGQTAIVITDEDPVSPISAIGKFAKESEKPQFKVGFVEGSLQDKDGLIKLSKLPGKDALFGQVLGSLIAPSYGLVGVLNGNMQKLLYILNAKRGETNG